MFKFQSKSLMMLALATAVAVPVAAYAAGPATVHASATFRSAISLNTDADLDFSMIDYSNTSVGSADYVTIDPSSAGATYHGVFAAASGATPTKGDVHVVTGDAYPITIECSTSATLVNGSNTIDVTGVTIKAGGSNHACAGLSTPAAQFTLTGGGADHILVGGKLDGSTASGGTIASGTYTSNASGGADITVNVFYQ